MIQSELSRPIKAFLGLLGKTPSLFCWKDIKTVAFEVLLRGQEKNKVESKSKIQVETRS